MNSDGNELTDRIEVSWGIDATPDGGYALRILRAYREQCDFLYADNASGEAPSNPIAIIMNDMQLKRAAELDRAIAALEAATLASVRVMA